MVRLREIPRTAAFAWSPGSEVPIVVTGTRAGAVDADFSDETKLELWQLDLNNAEQGVELQSIASILADSRFHDIAWAPASEGHPRGIIAGALENGSLDLWDAAKLINGDDDAFISRTSKHTGAIKSLQFNPLKPQILATAGTKGELYIYDVQNISEPYRLGTAAARPDDLECVAWNRRVPHILATGGSGGFVTVWDLKTKKASLTLNNNRKAVSAIAWDPNNATKLLTGTPDDSAPVILLWDLRNSAAPERTLQGHHQGILSLSWCQQDSDLLLSCGKDNRTICWNPQTGENLGEFPEVTNWTFQTRFHPHNPNLSATASFDGKIAIQTLQNTKTEQGQAAAQNPTDGEDFFAKAQSQPQEASFTLRKAPKWMERPAGVSFGFGGKLVTFSLQPVVAGKQRSSKVEITTFTVDSSVGDATDKFESALKSGDINTICDSHISQAKSEDEKADWKVIQALTTENPRKGVTEFLGVKDTEEVTNGVAEIEILGTEQTNSNVDDITTDVTDVKKNNRLSTMFTEGEDGDDFLSDLSATKEAKTNNPFDLFSPSESISDHQITKFLMLGQFEKAMLVCLKEDRMADAFMIANCGGKPLMDKAQAAYLAKSSKGPSYLRLLSAVVGKNLWDIVYNADLAHWKESMATLCTYADPDDFPDLCDALGDRILETGSRRDASFCYLVGAKLEKVINIWLEELEESREAALKDDKGGSSFSVHAQSLQSFIEKVTVFRNVAKFEDKEQSLTEGWKLSALYDRYVEYAEIVAAHGHLAVAEKYLDLVPFQYATAEVARNRVKKASGPTNPRAQTARQTTERPTTRSQPTNSFQLASNLQPTNSFQPVNNFRPISAISTSAAPSAASNPYAPSAPVPVTNPYAPPASTTTNSYAPQAGYVPAQQAAPPAQALRYGASFPTPGGFSAPQQFGAPPRAPAAPLAPPPSQKKTTEQWNDMPSNMVAKPKIARRSTPSQPPITSPFPNQSGLVMPPPTAPFGGPRGSATPPPPPPKGSAPSRVTSPLAVPPSSNFAAPPRTSSTSSNIYAPPPQAQQTYAQAPPKPQGTSPYNAAPPTAGPPPSNRYAPAPNSQFSQPSAAVQGQVVPAPPMNIRPPPPQSTNSYAPPPQSFNSYAPQPQTANAYGLPSQQPQQQPQQSFPAPSLTQAPPSQGPPRSTQQPPPQGPPSAAARALASPPVSKPSTPVTSKYPPGDRSHVPANAQNLVNILVADMQRVAAKAPASFAPQVKDTQKRLNLLYDHLNNEELVSAGTVQELSDLATALQNKDYETASKLQVKIQSEKTNECGNWMVGVKRLVSMSKATP